MLGKKKITPAITETEKLLKPTEIKCRGKKKLVYAVTWSTSRSRNLLKGFPIRDQGRKES